MNERKLSNFCLFLLAFSMLLRLICATGADARMAESVPAAQTEPDEPAAPAAQQLRGFGNAFSPVSGQNFSFHFHTNHRSFYL